MSNTITDVMIRNFNNILQHEVSLLRLVREDNQSGYIEILLPYDKFISYSRIELSEDFYLKLADFFVGVCGISSLCFDDMGTTFWAFGDNRTGYLIKERNIVND